MEQESLLHTLTQANDSNSLLVAQDLAMELGCGLPIDTMKYAKRCHLSQVSNHRIGAQAGTLGSIDVIRRLCSSGGAGIRNSLVALTGWQQVFGAHGIQRYI